MVDWEVDRWVTVRRQWLKDGTPDTSGSVNVEIFYFDQNGDKQYLQNDDSFTSTQTSYPMVLDGDFWEYTFQVPETSANKLLVVDAIHSVYELLLTEEHLIEPLLPPAVRHNPGLL